MSSILQRYDKERGVYVVFLCCLLLRLLLLSSLLVSTPFASCWLPLTIVDLLTPDDFWSAFTPSPFFLLQGNTNRQKRGEVNGGQRRSTKVNKSQRKSIRVILTFLFAFCLFQEEGCRSYVFTEKYVNSHRQIGLDGLGRVSEDVRPPDAYLLFPFSSFLLPPSLLPFFFSSSILLPFCPSPLLLPSSHFLSIVLFFWYYNRYCILGLTMEDLFTDHTDEFTVGAANMEGKQEM